MATVKYCAKLDRRGVDGFGYKVNKPRGILRQTSREGSRDTMDATEGRKFYTSGRGEEFCSEKKKRRPVRGTPV